MILDGKSITNDERMTMRQSPSVRMRMDRGMRYSCMYEMMPCSFFAG